VASRTKVADDTIETLATNLVISGEAIEEASRRGLLAFTSRRNFPSWRFGDARNGCFRRLDGEPFRIKGESVKDDECRVCFHRNLQLCERTQRSRFPGGKRVR
jgi:hypothetical protein